MAKTIGVTDGGGRILNSAGQRNEAEAFRKPARWVDYSGPITSEQTAGITLMDHPANLNHPSPFHVHNNGWMGISLTLERPCHDYCGETLASPIRVVDSPAMYLMRTNWTSSGKSLHAANWPR